VDHDAQGGGGVPHRAERRALVGDGALGDRPLMEARDALGIVASGRTLSREEARATMGSVMAGEATAAQLGALLAALHVRGETVDEIAGFAAALRDVAVRVAGAEGAMDIVGTGGDRSNSFN